MKMDLESIANDLSLIRRDHSARDRLVSLLVNNKIIEGNTLEEKLMIVKVGRALIKAMPRITTPYLERLNGYADSLLSDVLEQEATSEGQELLVTSTQYRADILMTLGRRDNDREAFEASYKFRMCAAEMSFEKDIEKAGYMYDLAADTARELYSITGEITWAIREYDTLIKAVKILTHFNERHAAFTMGFAATAAKKVWEKSQDQLWERRWFEGELDSANRLVRYREDRAIGALIWAKSIALTRYGRIDDDAMANEWYQESMKFAEGKPDKTKKQIYHIAADTCQRIRRVSGLALWTHKEYRARKKILNLDNISDRSKLKQLEELYQMSVSMAFRYKSEMWRQRSINFCKQFIGLASNDNQKQKVRDVYEQMHAMEEQPNDNPRYSTK